MSEYMPEDMRDRMPDRMPEDMSDRMPEDMSDRMPEDMPEDMSDRMPNRMSEDMSDRMPEDLPVRKCINVMVGITRSKVISIYGKHSSQLTNSIIFQRGRYTTSQILNCWPILKAPYFGMTILIYPLAN